MSSDRQRKLDAVVARLQLQYGPRAVQKAAPAPEPIAYLSTTFPDLDTALGTGGLPRGRITEIVGPATSGKVTLAAKTLSAAHAERDALVAWLDLPRTCDPDYLHRCGLDLDRLLVVRPRDAADALAITLHLVESNTLAALVFDGTAQMAQADPAIVAGSLERLATLVTQTHTAVIFLTERASALPKPGAPTQTLAHVATVRLALRREQWLMRGNDVRGYAGQVEILKHKLGRAGAVVPLRILFNGTVRGDGL
jgi:recombination protein RecA